MSEKRKNMQSGYIPLLFLVCLMVVLLSACDLKIQLPALFAPTKNQLKRVIEADLPNDNTVAVAFEGDDVTISFSHAVDADVITSTFKKIFSALGNHADTGSISINGESFTLKSSSESLRAGVYVLKTINTTFTDPSKEEIPYTASIQYRGERFLFTGELVFHDIHRKMLAPIDVVTAFRKAHETALELNAHNLTLEDSLPILEALQDFENLSVEAKLLLSAEKTKLDTIEQAFVTPQLTSDEAAAYQVIKMIVAIPSLDDLHITDKHLVDQAMNAYKALTSTQQSLVENFDKLAEAQGAFGEYTNTIDMIGDEKHDGLFIVNRSVSSNDLGVVQIGTVQLQVGGEDVSSNYSFKFFDPYNKDNQIWTFDLSEGASTFIAYMIAEPNTRGYDSIEATVVFKYGSVSIRGDEQLYTIEDAINKAGDDEIIVKYNTSFAAPDVAQMVYHTTDYRIGSQTTLLLPSAAEYSNKVNDSATHNKASDGPFVQLRIPEGITLSVKGRMIVHAKRQSNGQYQGFVAHPYYSILQIDEDATVQVEYRGRLDVLGYATGGGSITAESGSTIHESLFISSYRGGAITSEIYNSVFPFDQFTANQIECDLIITSGASYIANSFLLIDGSYLRSEIKLIGSEAIIDLL
ncbi:MAG: Ig-like domain-containing protein, partial [Proteobacteria bacterium]|nr:Ig-like domain-containing protein [Pseudomonadota bacterium]